MRDAVARPRPRRRRIWKILGAVLVLLLAGGVWLYFTHLWVFFVRPGPGGKQLALPITPLAGNGEAGFADGQGAAARMRKPIRLAPYGDDAVVFADIENHAVRVCGLDGTVTTLAGGPDREGHQDGPGAQARFDSPHGVATRADGAIAVCEAAGNVVRLLVSEAVRSGPRGWMVTTLAGVPGESGFRDGPADEALFDAPHAVAWAPDGSLFVADIGNHRIRRIHDGYVTTVAGRDETGNDDGDLDHGTLKWPMDIAFGPDGALWIADAGRARVRRWRPGLGLDTPFGDREFAMPHGIAVVPDGHVALAELYGHRILRLDPATGAIDTYCGTTEDGMGPGQLKKPAAVLAHAGRLWIADMGNHRIVTVPLEGKSSP